jgi:CzcA family heavy metal efflux pump
MTHFLNAIVKGSIAQRWLVVFGYVLATCWGLWLITQMPLDVFPSFAPPQVEIQTEAPGLAPEEIEALVTRPIESALNGTPGVETVRSASAVGVSVVNVIFGWDSELYQARQLVSERLQQAELPEGIEAPHISPPSSPLGAVVKYAFTSTNTSLMDVRQIVDGPIKNRLLAVPGVTQVVVFGGDVRQYQVLIDPAKLQAYGVSLEQVTAATERSNVNAPGGFLNTPDQELLVRGMGRVQSIEELAQSVVTTQNGVPVLLAQVATVQVGAQLKRGDGMLNGAPAIVLIVNKQPMADTPTVTQAVEAAMAEMKAGLPADVTVTNTFSQEDFIKASVQNVEEGLRDGILIVSVVMVLFLMNWRTVVISLSAIPVSLVLGLVIMKGLGLGLNTMTLGGLAVAIGSVVDDAIVDMENVYRRLRENQQLRSPKNPLQVVFDGSLEVRVSVLLSTVIIAVVFAPIFALSGVEGRIFTPMGLAYLLSILAATVVALSLTPALCALLLVNRALPMTETWVARKSADIYRPALRFAVAKPKLILVAVAASFVAAMVVLPTLGKVFLPEFQERSLVISTTLYPGVSLQTTNEVDFAFQDALKEDSRFDTLQLRSGRAPGDSHIVGANFAELDVELSDEGLKDRTGAIDVIRHEFERIPGVAVGIGGFISHRLDEVLSGVRSAIAIKIFGPDLEVLRSLGQQVEAAMATVPGVVDLQLEQQIPIKQVQILFNRTAASRYGLQAGDIADTIETALNGKTVSQVLEQQQVTDLIVWLQPEARQSLQDIGNLLIDTPTGQKVPLAQVATVQYGTGPNTINHENVSRMIVVSANINGRDLGSIIGDIRAQVQNSVSLPAGYFIQYGGQFQAQEQATQSLLMAGAIAFLIISVLIYFAAKTVSATLMIMINLPLAMVGGVFSIALGGGVLSVASMIGFITLFGVATRNGLLLVDNYNNKLAAGLPLKDVIVQGSLERLEAILMTAVSSAMGMAPLVISSGAGKEILQPLAVVVFGGLFTSTALTLLVLPALYSQFGRALVVKTTNSQEVLEVSQQPLRSLMPDSS